MSGYNRFGRLARFTGSSLVDSAYSKLVSRTLVKILYGERRVRCRIIVDFQPFAATLAPLHVIT